MNKEVIVTIPGQGVEVKTPEQLIRENVASYDNLLSLNPRLITKFLSPNSYGLYTALVVAGAVTLAVGIKLAVDRARIVSEAEDQREKAELGRTGMIAVLGKDLNYVTGLAARYGLDITNFNGPLAHVLGGLREKFEAIKQELGNKALELNVEGIYHNIIRRAESLLYEELLDQVPISDPQIPLIFSTRPRIGHSAQDIKAELHEQMIHPVDLAGKVEIWKQTGVEVVIDIGEGGSMKKLTRRMAGPDLKVLALVEPEDRVAIASLR